MAGCVHYLAGPKNSRVRFTDPEHPDGQILTVGDTLHFSDESFVLIDMESHVALDRIANADNGLSIFNDDGEWIVPRFFCIVPPAGMLSYEPSEPQFLLTGSRARLIGLAARPELNGVEVHLLWRDSERWAVHRSDPSAQIRVRRQNLELMGLHAPSREAALVSEAKELVGAAHAAEASAGGTMEFGLGEAAPELCAEIAMIHILNRLTRCTVHEIAEAAIGSSRRVTCGELDVASLVCKNWHGVVLATRALTPACARDVSLKRRLEAEGGAPAVDLEGAASVSAQAVEQPHAEPCDGEVTIYHDGDRAKPLRIFVHNLLSSRPTEFISLGARAHANFSFIPAGGAIRGMALAAAAAAATRPDTATSGVATHAATRFTKLRVCPWLLLVKTDDYSFTSSLGSGSGTLHQVNTRATASAPASAPASAALPPFLVRTLRCRVHAPLCACS